MSYFINDEWQGAMEEALAERDDRVQDALAQGYWYKNDWSKIAISDMKSSHINNCIHMINRNNLRHLMDYIPVFEDELSKRGVIIL